MQRKFDRVENLDCYQVSYAVSNKVWKIVKGWDYFCRSTIGNQFVRSTDSISANIAEGFGRYTKKDKIRFYRIAYASTLESLDWLTKIEQRQLLKPHELKQVNQALERLPKLINQLIQYTNKKLRF